MLKPPNESFQPTGNNGGQYGEGFSGCSCSTTRRLNFRFPPPLRSGGNAALSGSAWLSPPLRYGENQALETDAPPGHRSAPH
jgi:hypothetical protein